MANIDKKRMPAKNKCISSIHYLSFQIQIIVMHQRTFSMFAQHQSGICRTYSDTPYPYLYSSGIHNPHNIIFFEISLDTCYTYRQDTYRLLAF